MSVAVPMIEIAQERLRGVGHLSAQRAEKKITLPLTDVRISARVADQVATVELTQTFQNPYPDHLEAVYIFPLPGGAAVSDFEMRAANRLIRGRVEERGEARRQYQQALDEGKRAAMMEKERDDVFTVQVGNIPPNEEVSIKITYSEKLIFFEEGTTELRLPLVVAPRYTPGQTLMRDQVGDGVESDTDIVPDASRISPPRLVKGFDPKVALNIDIVILWDDSNTEIKDLCCSQHAMRTSAGREGVKVSLAREDEALDRDFVLRWTLSGSDLRSSLLVYKDSNSGQFSPFSETEMYYGMMSLFPPKSKALVSARDIVFVLDRSGSMQGVKMASAARACALLLATLGPKDRFAIQSYSSNVDWYKPPSFSYGVDGYFMPADYWGLEQGEKYLRSVVAGGGTETNRAISEAINVLGQRQDKQNRTPVIVLLTDGEISNESQILKEAQSRLEQTRLFTVGIDTAVNQGFLQRLADIGQGTATFVAPGTELESALIRVSREIGSPLVVDLKIYDVDSDLQLSSVAPSRITDLFNGRSTTTFFMLKKPGKVRISGKYANGENFETIVEAKEVQIPAIGQLWAKTRINDLEDWYRLDKNSQPQIKEQIVSTSIKHKILTKFTAFIAVDEEEIVNQEGATRKVVQPVEIPAQWEMSKTLSKNETLSSSVRVTRAAGHTAMLGTDLLKSLSITPSIPSLKAAGNGNLPVPAPREPQAERTLSLDHQLSALQAPLSDLKSVYPSTARASKNVPDSKAVTKEVHQVAQAQVAPEVFSQVQSSTPAKSRFSLSFLLALGSILLILAILLYLLVLRG